MEGSFAGAVVYVNIETARGGYDQFAQCLVGVSAARCSAGNVVYEEYPFGVEACYFAVLHFGEVAFRTVVAAKLYYAAVIYGCFFHGLLFLNSTNCP